MIVCSCRIVCTQKIKECIERIPNPTAKTVLKELGWKPECATCVKNIIKEINSILEQGK